MDFLSDMAGAAAGGGLGGEEEPEASHVGSIHINPPEVPEHFAPKPLIIQPMYVKPKLRMAKSSVIKGRKLMYKNNNKNYRRNNYQNIFSNNFNKNYLNSIPNRNIKVDLGDRNLTVNPRELTYTHSFPFAPYDFYSLPDKGTEMPFNVINYGEKMPAEPDESIKERTRKKNALENMQRYDNSKTRFGEIGNEVGKIGDELTKMVDHLKKGFGKIEEKLMNIKNTQYSLL